MAEPTEPKEPKEPKEPTPEPKEPKEGGIPEWGQKMQEQLDKLADLITGSNQQPNNQQQVPVPAEPNHQEPEPIIEPEPQQEPKPKSENPVKRFLSWLM